jgi:hypothetical protein
MMNINQVLDGLFLLVWLVYDSMVWTLVLTLALAALLVRMVMWSILTVLNIGNNYLPRPLNVFWGFMYDGVLGVVSFVDQLLSLSIACLSCMSLMYANYPKKFDLVIDKIQKKFQIDFKFQLISFYSSGLMIRVCDQMASMFKGLGGFLEKCFQCIPDNSQKIAVLILFPFVIVLSFSHSVARKLSTHLTTMQSDDPKHQGSRAFVEMKGKPVKDPYQPSGIPRQETRHRP